MMPFFISKSHYCGSEEEEAEMAVVVMVLGLVVVEEEEEEEEKEEPKAADGAKDLMAPKQRLEWRKLMKRRRRRRRRWRRRSESVGMRSFSPLQKKKKNPSLSSSNSDRSCFRG